MEDDRGGLERRLMDRAEGMEQMGRYQSPLTGLLREAADAIGAARRALEAWEGRHRETSLQPRAPFTTPEQQWQRNSASYGQAVDLTRSALAKLEGGG